MDASSSTVTHPPAPPPQITPGNHNSQNASCQPSTSSSSQEASHLSIITSTSSVHLPSTSSAPALLQQSSADLEFPRPPIRDESLGEAFLLYWKIRIDSIFKGLENKSINQLKYHDFETYRQIALLRISSHLKR